ncbi:TlyA family RNA methyltransferase [Salinicola socius]|uniref:TlyA family rRNA (Cytidine-2'-O)-methyltransferase n=1 Tax=Salinicola socius TaxID=404433 RepID=A0A1Q8SQN7_9GAMM|nr:TlyA family RNA methyltransferase [Salinicola socius]OLO03727.1 TlyA family rRNA (cytidine-2'-O)-methyltransferase [Salinicola socius]
MKRLDQLVTVHVRSRTRAQRLIRQGHVSIDAGGGWRVVTKPGEKLPETTELRIAEAPEERYVSRAGLKLEALLETMGRRLDGFTVLDIGQSTGGFSDCALRYGAKRIVGIEVGHDQLDVSLRDDDRVTCLEGVNARQLPSTRLETLAPEGFDAVVMDVSFISQTLILPEIARVLRAGGELYSLVKPQFEVGPGKVDSRGIVRDAGLYRGVADTLHQACDSLGLDIDHWQESPIQGGDGNHEFLLHALRR